jgi:hypothetical protein
MNEIDTFCTDKIVCPHCGHRYEDSWDYCPDSEPAEYDCEFCGGAFRVTANISVNYTTVKIDE